VNVTAYAHLKSSAGMGHMLCPFQSENKFFISANWKTAEKPGKVLVNPWKMCYD
jgi:hypothetical protein